MVSPYCQTNIASNKPLHDSDRIKHNQDSLESNFKRKNMAVYNIGLSHKPAVFKFQAHSYRIIGLHYESMRKTN